MSFRHAEPPGCCATGRSCCSPGASGALHDAYPGAVAAHLSAALGCPAPGWCREKERVLDEPWFAVRGHHMHALLLVESPAAFRARNLFVTANTFSVA